MNSIQTTCLLVVLLSTLAGCGHEVVPSAGPRPPLAAEVVRIYPDFPRKYERLGVITLPITRELSWDHTGGRADAVYARLKSQAAALGGNGLLLYPDADQFDYFASAREGKQAYRLPIRAKPTPTAVAEAIYVINE